MNNISALDCVYWSIYPVLVLFAVGEPVFYLVLFSIAQEGYIRVPSVSYTHLDVYKRQTDH